ncbi:hypothetical protein [Microbulbifer sediminum]|uniref:hypothetical protein n=1 Tax=Microbulbifer sediminum TaxID=2904250 RepID=UPI001F1EFFC3|nr:hypothetical protein [Microbulbifer sediminum]
MGKATQINGGFSVFVDQVRDFYGAWYGRLIIDVLVYLPASLIGLYVSVDKFREEIKKILPDFLVSALDTQLVFFFLGALGFIYIFREILPNIFSGSESPQKQVTVEGAISLIETFGRIVSAKLTRFSDTLSGYSKKGQVPSASEIFNSITKPEQQILFTINALQVFLESITKNVNIDVRLVEVKNKLPTVWYAHAPEERPPETDIEDLQHPDSALMNCVKSSKMIVVPDIKKEAANPGKRKYVLMEEESGGSAICLPVYHPASKTYPFVITIRADKPNLFSPKRKNFYRWLLSQFAQRIQLEYSLVLLKEAQSDDSQKR